MNLHIYVLLGFMSKELKFLTENTIKSKIKCHFAAEETSKMGPPYGDKDRKTGERILRLRHTTGSKKILRKK